MDWKIVVEITGVIGGIATIMALFLGPMFYLGAKIDMLRVEVKGDINALRSEFKQDMSEFRKDMADFRAETKDFHARLCVIEQRDRK